MPTIYSKDFSGRCPYLDINISINIKYKKELLPDNTKVNKFVKTDCDFFNDCQLYTNCPLIKFALIEKKSPKQKTIKQKEL